LSLNMSSSEPSPPLFDQSFFCADPSAHVFNDTLYVFPSHDRETDIKFNDNGDQYDMADYHVISIPAPPFDPDDLTTAPKAAVDHGVALTAEDIPWVSKQVWAPDAAFNASTGKYHLFFPARDKEGRFRMGVAVGDQPEGPFEPQPNPIKGSFSIDPASFVDKDGSCYLYFGGIWGGELQCYGDAKGTQFNASQLGPKEPSGEGVYALGPRVGRMDADMLEFDAEGVKEITLLDPATGKPILADDHEKRFFEASWMHVHDGKYYFSYSTGDTHFICYAIGDNPLGPFTYKGKLLDPVLGWTNHHSIVEWRGRTWVFYHDCTVSGGTDHLRSVRMREAWYDAEGGMHLSPQ
jgi:hypothetical protein